MKYKPGTFIVVPNKAIIQTLKANVQAVYLAICGRVNDGGNCYPSWTTIAKEAGVGKRTVPKCIDILIEAGVLHKKHRVDEQGDLTSNLYQIIVLEGNALPARPVRQPLHEGSAAVADITKSPYLNKKEDMSSNDDTSLSFFKKPLKNKSETYLQNELRLQELLAAGEFQQPKYDFFAIGPYDWRYVINHGASLTPERYMLAVFWNERNKYKIVTEQFNHSYTFIRKEIADAVIRRDLAAARKLANCIEYKQIPKLVEYASDKAYDEKEQEFKWEFKIATLLRYVEEFDYSQTVW